MSRIVLPDICLSSSRCKVIEVVRRFMESDIILIRARRVSRVARLYIHVYSHVHVGFQRGANMATATQLCGAELLVDVTRARALTNFTLDLAPRFPCQAAFLALHHLAYESGKSCTHIGRGSHVFAVRRIRCCSPCWWQRRASRRTRTTSRGSDLVCHFGNEACHALVGPSASVIRRTSLHSIGPYSLEG